MESQVSNKFLVNFQDYRESVDKLDKKWSSIEFGKYLENATKYTEWLDSYFDYCEMFVQNDVKTRFVGLRIFYRYMEEIIKRRSTEKLAHKYHEESHLSLSGIVKTTRRGTMSKKLLNQEVNKLLEMEFDMLETLNFDLNAVTVMDYVELFLATFWTVPCIGDKDMGAELADRILSYYCFFHYFPKDIYDDDVHVTAASLIILAIKVITENASECKATIRCIEKFVGLNKCHRALVKSNRLHSVLSRGLRINI